MKASTHNPKEISKTDYAQSLNSKVSTVSYFADVLLYQNPAVFPSHLHWNCCFYSSQILFAANSQGTSLHSMLHEVDPLRVRRQAILLLKWHVFDHESPILSPKAGEKRFKKAEILLLDV